MGLTACGVSPGSFGSLGLERSCGVLELLDPGTRAHSIRVMRLSLSLGRALDLPEESLGLLGLSALLHDVGKVKVPDWVLQKRGPLSPVERSMIQMHPSAGAAILRAEGFCDQVVLGALHHHERFDGWGYPEGLRGEEIPFFARIIAVADAFEAMTSRRPYRNAMGHRDALEEILHHRFDQFDPALAEAFAEVCGFVRPEGSCFTELPDTPNMPHGDLMHSIRVPEVH